MVLQLGEKVIWEIGGDRFFGVFLEDNKDNTSAVVVKGGIVNIETNILKLDI